MKNKIKILESSKYTINEKTIYFVGCISEVIFDRKLFKSNYELKSYIKIFEDILMIEPYRDYLYAARPQLFARLIRDLLYPRKTITIEEQQLVTKAAIEAHLNYVLNSIPKEEKINKKIENKTTMLNDLIRLRKEKEYHDK